MEAALASAAHLEARGAAAPGSARARRRVFFGTGALLFSAAASATVLWCTSMSEMGEMPMPGGWTLSMVWMRMPGQTWLGVAAAFLGMWTLMMVAMMLPSLVPVLWRCVEAPARAGESGVSRPGRRAVRIATGYFSVWVALGLAVFVLGSALAALDMQEPELARAMPIAAGLIVFAAGAFQLTSCKAHHLTRCREVPCSAGPWQHGLRLGLHCCSCSAGSTAILLVTGMMDLRTMAAVTAAVTVERLAPAGERVAQALGVAAMGAGLMRIISGA